MKGAQVMSERPIGLAVWITAPVSPDAETGRSLSGRMSTGEIVASVSNPPERKGLVPLFRRSFPLVQKPETALLRVTAAGVYRLSVNGSPLNYSLCDPGWTDYPKRLQVQSYRVETLLGRENTIEILAAGGWACAGLLGAGAHFFSDRIRIWAELRLSFPDGHEEVLGSGGDWDVFRSHIRFSHPYQGEVIDLGAEPEYLGKALPSPLSVPMIPQEKEPVTEHERLPALREFPAPRGERILDFGQNLSGYVELKVRGRKGAVVRIRHAELLDETGEPYVKNLRTAAQTMEYILGRDGETLLKPVFVLQGFRYSAIETEGEVSFGMEDATAVAVYTDMRRTGEISCGNGMIDRLCSCILWNLRSNFIEVPTDCPQRDERLGWLGDAEVFAPSASFYYDVKNFYRCWLRDVVSGQREDGGIPAIAPYNRQGYPFRVSAAWADAISIVPWVLYEQYGDLSILEEFYPAILRYIGYLRRAGPVEELWLEGNHYGDWLALDGPDPRNPKTSKDFIASAYYYRTLDLAVRAGLLLGRDVDALRELKSRVRQAFRERFLGLRETYAELSLLLQFGLLDEEEMPEAARQLAELVERSGNRLLAGVVGAPLILHALSENGYARKAYDLLLEEEVPSWLGMLRHGATTLWERLDTFTEAGMKDIRNASLNHYMFGSVLDWLVEGAGGLRALEPGYGSFLWKPLPDKRLGSLHLRKETPAGVIEAAWSYEGEEVSFTLTVPEGSTARILLPDGSGLTQHPGTFRSVLAAL